MKYIYLVLLAIIVGACVGKGDKQAVANQCAENLLTPADSFAIDSTTHSCIVTRWNHAEYDDEGELAWDEWRSKDCDVVLSQDILVEDHPSQVYHVYEKSPWTCAAPGVYSCILHATDQDDLDCSIILKVAEESHVLMYVLFDNEAFCYDMEMLSDDLECYD